MPTDLPYAAEAEASLDFEELDVSDGHPHSFPPTYGVIAFRFRPAQPLGRLVRSDLVLMYRYCGDNTTKR